MLCVSWSFLADALSVSAVSAGRAKGTLFPAGRPISFYIDRSLSLSPFFSSLSGALSLHNASKKKKKRERPGEIYIEKLSKAGG